MTGALDGPVPGVAADVQQRARTALEDERQSLGKRRIGVVVVPAEPAVARGRRQLRERRIKRVPLAKDAVQADGLLAADRVLQVVTRLEAAVLYHVHVDAGELIAQHARAGLGEKVAIGLD